MAIGAERNWPLGCFRDLWVGAGLGVATYLGGVADRQLATWLLLRTSGRAGAIRVDGQYPWHGKSQPAIRCWADATNSAYVASTGCRRFGGSEFATSDTRATLSLTTERRWSDCTNHVEVAVARGAPSTRSRSSEGDQRAPGKTTAATVRPRSGQRIPSGAVPISGPGSSRHGDCTARRRSQKFAQCELFS